MDEIAGLATRYLNTSKLRTERYNRTAFLVELARVLTEFQTKVTEAVKEHGWDGKDGTDVQWSYAGALLYAVTVITTIGESMGGYPVLCL